MRLNISGGWLLYGQWLHRGNVYLDGEAFHERKIPEDVKQQPQTWCCRASEKNTTIWANFGKGNPNTRLAEINVRESVFMPARSGLNYITVSGFHVLHSAENWQPPVIPLQMGAIGPRMGKHWIIENCTVTNARCVGISLGQAPGVDYTDIDAFGADIVRNNVIRRCGEAGIAGQKGATRCLIAGNLIEDTNYRKEFGGWETAAIKFHESVDTLIRGNLIRRVSYQNYGAFGIWMDWANQGTRITGNVIYDTQAANVFLEMDHGPILVDNNVLVGQGVRSNSEGCVFATIFSWTANSRWSPTSRDPRNTTSRIPEKRLAANAASRQTTSGSTTSLFVGGWMVSRRPPGTHRITMFSWKARRSPPSAMNTARLTPRRSSSVGKRARWTFLSVCRSPRLPFALVPRGWMKSWLEFFRPLGRRSKMPPARKIRVDTDLLGHKRTAPVPGPLADVKPNANVLHWSVERQYNNR